MAEYANLVRRALGQIGGHGGVRGFFLQLFRVNDIKTGTLIGVDKYGNKYFEDKKHYFFGEFTASQICSRSNFVTEFIFVLHYLFFCSCFSVT
ncbi:hypothetical protein XENORESO_021502 [Xenotaenia resolanae]|uniref:NADH dehydrogenase [ubiquinone] 1 alpha subcomplex subunit 12 n=1 Tax=Xenotaenia resolanae TaxID=208358 RepID=A0ABV0W3Q9_9TELE